MAGNGWFTRWIGDTIGMLVVTPLMLLWTVGLRIGRWRRTMTVSLPLAVTLGLVVALLLYVSVREQDRVARDFERRTDYLAQALKKNVDSSLEVLHGVESLFGDGHLITRGDFRRFVGRPLARHPWLQEVSWNLRVVGRERSAYEEATRRRGQQGFHITQLTTGGQVAPAAERPEYVVVHFVEPYRGNEETLGFDSASDPTSLRAMERARDTAALVATPPIPLVERLGRPSGYRVFLAIFHAGRPPETVERRRQNIRGYASATFQVPDVVNAALKGLEEDRWAATMQIFEADASEPERLLYEDTPRGRGGAGSAIHGQPLRRSIALTVGGREWSVEFTARPEYLAAQRGWQGWTVLAAGLLFTVLLGAVLLVVTGRTAEVERVVNERTRELKQTNQALAAEVSERKRSQHALEAKNAELDSFVYSVSHDLKSPLVAAQGMAGALLEDYADRLDGQGCHYLSRLQANVDHMERLIQELLLLSRVGRESRGSEAVSLAEVVSEVLGELAAPIRERGIKVSLGDLGAVRAVRTQIQQVLSNLIGNAVKYIGDTVTPTIEIGSAARGGTVECWVRDNGIGIDPAYHSKVFEIFQRLHDVEAEGTGIGLAIVKKSVEAAGGRIWLESAPGLGSTFRFTWPAAD